MKLKNIFKKNSKNTAKAKVQSLDKKQLEKVNGGMALPGPSKEEIEARE